MISPQTDHHIPAAPEPVDESPPECCVVCGTAVPDYEPKYCCDGTMCCCRGLPIEPCVCSKKCWDKLLERIGKDSTRRVV